MSRFRRPRGSLSRQQTGPRDGEPFNAKEWNEVRDLAFAVATRLGLSEHDAIDVAQVVMAQLLEKVREGQVPREPRAWVRTVASRRTYDLMRRKDRQAIQRTDTELQVVELISDPSQEDEDLVQRIYASGLLEEVLAVAETILSPKQYKVVRDLYLHRNQSITVIEMIRAIVEEAGGTEADVETARTHWRRACKKLRAIDFDSSRDPEDGGLR